MINNMDNFYIKLFEFANKYPKGFDYQTLEDTIKPEDWEKKIIQQYLKNACENNARSSSFDMTILGTPFITLFTGSDYFGKECKYTLSYDAYFNYLDYIELKEARKWSKDAEKHAKVAISIAIVSLVLSIIFSIWQILQPTKINEEQFDDVISLIKFLK